MGLRSKRRSAGLAIRRRVDRYAIALRMAVRLPWQIVVRNCSVGSISPTATFSARNCNSRLVLRLKTVAGLDMDE
ncbi:hypothetical protein D3C85_399130 [compost metagenome]